MGAVASRSSDPSSKSNWKIRSSDSKHASKAPSHSIPGAIFACNAVSGPTLNGTRMLTIRKNGQAQTKTRPRPAPLGANRGSAGRSQERLVKCIHWTGAAEALNCDTSSVSAFSPRSIWVAIRADPPVNKCDSTALTTAPRLRRPSDTVGSSRTQTGRPVTSNRANPSRRFCPADRFCVPGGRAMLSDRTPLARGQLNLFHISRPRTLNCRPRLTSPLGHQNAPHRRSRHRPPEPDPTTAGCSPAMVRSNVVLPDPLGPRRIKYLCLPLG